MTERFVAIDFLVRDIDTGFEFIDVESVADVLNDYEKENKQLKSIKNKYRGQRDYLLFVIERCCSKEKYEETKQYLVEVVDDYE